MGKTKLQFKRVMVMLAVGVLVIPGLGPGLEASPAAAADYPDRPVNFLVPYAPGGPSDIQARAIASAAEPLLGQPLMVLNKPGASGSVMMSLLATAKPDGYTIGITPGSLTVTPYIQQVTYDLTKDFTYLVALTTYTENFTVLAESPWKTFKDLVEYARQNPKKVRIGTSGFGTSPSVMVNVVGKQAGVDWIEIPFKSNGEVNTALLGGHIEVGAVSGENIPQVRAGRLRLLALAIDERIKEFPEVPTLRELGYDFVALSYCGIAGPKGLPEPVIKKLEDVFRKARDESVYVETMKKIYLVPTPEVGKDFEKRMVDNYVNAGNYLKKAPVR